MVEHSQESPTSPLDVRRDSDGVKKSFWREGVSPFVLAGIAGGIWWFVEIAA